MGASLRVLLRRLRRSGGPILGLLALLHAPQGSCAEDLPGPQVRPPQKIERRHASPPAAGAKAATQPVPPAARPATDDLPLQPPQPSPGRSGVQPGGGLFEVDRPGGVIRTFPDGEDRYVLVLTGNPRLSVPAHMSKGQSIPALSIKANTLVLWVDARRFSEQQGLADLLGGVPLGPAATAPAPATQGASQIPGFLEAIYAEGAVELVYGTFSFRAFQIYLEPHNFKGLLVEPRLDGRAVGVEAEHGGLPLFVRARRARLIGRGVATFDEAEVSTSRADDHIQLNIRTLTVAELAEPKDEAGVERPHVLGYQDLSTQAYTARQIQVQGERIPLFWAPSAEFGMSPDAQAFPVRIDRFRTGSQDRFGRIAFLRMQGPDVGPKEDPWFRWFAEGGGYTDRGWAGGVDVQWRHEGHDHPLPGFGNLTTWVVNDGKSRDSDGFTIPEPVRWRYVGESRTWLRPDLFLDVEASDFSDSGMNHEFFESQDLTHKDYESYGRLYYAPTQPGNVVGTLIGKWHARDFTTETTELPQGAFWAQSVPLLVPRVRGAPGVDVTTWTRAGYLEHREANGTGMPDYSAWRGVTETQLSTGFDVGDLRVSAFGGVLGTSYQERTDGGEDLSNAAWTAGAKVDLQLHRVYGASGGLLALDGVRHIVDLDAGVFAQQGSQHGVEDLPQFDLTETQEDRTAFTVHMRNRLQTRRQELSPVLAASPYIPRTAETQSSTIRTLLDLDADVSWYLDDRGPFGQNTPGQARVSVWSEPRNALRVVGEGRWDFHTGLETAFLGAAGITTLNDRPLVLATGVRYLQDESLSLTLDVAWRWSPKYEVRFQGRYDREDNDTFTRLIFRRFSGDHVLVWGVSQRDDSLDLELNVEPAIGGVSGVPRAFEDQGGPDPLGSFLR